MRCNGNEEVNQVQQEVSQVTGQLEVRLSTRVGYLQWRRGASMEVAIRAQMFESVSPDA